VKTSLRALPLSLLACLPACGNLKFFSADYMNALGAEAYIEETGKYKEVRGTPQAEMVRRAGERIARASGKDYQWEFKLLDAPDVVNAFCLPGGKIAVYTGILPVTQNEDGLAVVLGHEVAHATEEHGNKRMSQGLLLEIGLVGVAAGLEFSKLKDDDKALILAGLGIGASLGVVLPYSREHESEADIVGLRYAIRAGYDPHEAPRLWERMARLGSSGPEFLSTHPDPLRRAQELRAAIPQLLAQERGQKQ
jgi:predicted Zn-dependent protease